VLFLMNYFKTCFLILLLCIGLKSLGQEHELRKNNIHLEVLGRGFYGSLVYERLIPTKQHYIFNLNAGTSIGRLYDFKQKFNPELLFPISVGLVSHTKHSPEIGVGFAILNRPIALNSKREFDFPVQFIAGYRFCKVGSRYLFRLYYSPFWFGGSDFWHWGGASIGYAL
jgi:hypothetical protein